MSATNWAPSQRERWTEWELETLREHAKEGVKAVQRHINQHSRVWRTIGAIQYKARQIGIRLGGGDE